MKPENHGGPTWRNYFNLPNITCTFIGGLVVNILGVGLLTLLKLLLQNISKIPMFSNISSFTDMGILPWIGYSFFIINILLATLLGVNHLINRAKTNLVTEHADNPKPNEEHGTKTATPTSSEPIEEKIEVGPDDITGFTNEFCYNPGIYQSVINPQHKIALRRGQLFHFTTDKYSGLHQTVWVLIQPHND